MRFIPIFHIKQKKFSEIVLPKPIGGWYPSFLPAKASTPSRHRPAWGGGSPAPSPAGRVTSDHTPQPPGVSLFLQTNKGLASTGQRRKDPYPVKQCHRGTDLAECHLRGLSY